MVNNTRILAGNSSRVSHRDRITFEEHHSVSRSTYSTTAIITHKTANNFEDLGDVLDSSDLCRKRMETVRIRRGTVAIICCSRYAFPFAPFPIHQSSPPLPIPPHLIADVSHRRLNLSDNRLKSPGPSRLGISAGGSSTFIKVQSHTGSRYRYNATDATRAHSRKSRDRVTASLYRDNRNGWRRSDSYSNGRLG